VVLKRLISGQLVKIHLKLSVVIRDWIGFALLENATGPTDRQLPSLLQKLANFLSTELGTLVQGNFLHSLIYLIEIRHLFLYPDLLNGTTMAVPKGVDPVQRLDVKIFRNGHLYFVVLVM